MRQIVLLTVLLFNIAITAQKVPMKWGKVPQEHLDMTIYEADSSANAVVLCDYGSTEFEVTTNELQANFFRHIRIKLFDQAAIEEYGNIVLAYFPEEPIFGFKANVIHPDGTIVSMAKKDWVTEKESEYLYKKKISLPQLKPGVIIEYKYQLTDKNWTSIPDWKFQREIPTLHSELRVDMPDWLLYVKMIQGDEAIQIKSDGRTEVLGGYSVNLDLSTYIAKNVPALRAEPYISTMDDYTMGIKFQLQEYRPTFATWKVFMSSWKNVVTPLLEDQFFGLQFLRKGKSKATLEAVAPKLAGLSSDKEKAIAIYDFVNANVETSSGGNRIYASTRVDDVFFAKKGTIAEKNLMILALFMANDIPSFPVLLSTRSNGKPYPFYPYTGQFDHMMVCALIDDKPFYLDAGSNYRPAGLPRIDALNKTVLTLNDAPNWIDVAPAKSSDVILANLKLDLEGNITGDFTANNTGYSAVDERTTFDDTNAKEVWMERLVDKYPDAEVTDVKVENQEDIYKPLSCKMNISISGAAQVNGDFIYINPMFYTNFDENPFKLEKRDFPVDMPYPIKEQLVYNFEVPEGYILDSPPGNANIVIPEKGGKFQFLINQTGNKIQVICKLTVNKIYYTPEEYYQIKQLFDVYVEKSGEQIVLKKA